LLESFEGTRLELFIAKSIGEAHDDGKVWAENNYINNHREKGAYLLLYSTNYQ